jgi:hypothetical protein
VGLGNADRGIGDRSPLFISRKIHLYVCYGSLLLMGLFLIYQFKALAWPFLVCILVYTRTPLFLSQSIQSLPNALLSITAGWITIFLLSYLMKKETSYLVLAYLAYLMGLNIKVDILLYIIPILFLSALHIKNKIKLFRLSEIKKYFSKNWPVITLLWSLTIFALVLFNPKLFFRPYDFFMIQANELFLHTSEQVDRRANFSALVQVYLTHFGAWFILGGGLLIAFFEKNLRKYIPLICLLLAIPLLGHVLVSLKAQPLYPRYFLASLSSLYLGLAALLMVFLSSKKRFYIGVTVAASIFLMAGFFYSFIPDLKNYGALYRSYAASGGFAPEYSRNEATHFIIEQVKKNKFKNSKILIDQYAYIDIRRFALNQIEVEYVNLENYQKLIKNQTGPVFVIFSPAQLDGFEEPAYKRIEYKRYVAALENLPQLRSFGRTDVKMQIVGESPVAPNDQVFVAVLK